MAVVERSAGPPHRAGALSFVRAMLATAKYRVSAGIFLCHLRFSLMTPSSPPPPSSALSTPQGSVVEVFLAFLKLGVTAFGGPMAHLGYFRLEFVERRQWIDDSGYADLVALCQFLPGPASSQVGFALGLGRAGWPGALAAWLGFTLPAPTTRHRCWRWSDVQPRAAITSAGAWTSSISTPSPAIGNSSLLLGCKKQMS